MNYTNKMTIGKQTPLSIISKLLMLNIPISLLAYLSEKLQVILLVYLVINNFTLLLIFSWILIKKPLNLYAPTDYKDEEKFLTALRWSNQRKNK